MLLRSQGRDAEAREALAGVVTANPRAGADEYVVVPHARDSRRPRCGPRLGALGTVLYPADARLR